MIAAAATEQLGEVAETAGVERDGLFDATCPETIIGRSITVGWRSVGFVHWAFEPDAVTRLLPPTVSVDCYGGRGWAGYWFTTVTPGRVVTDGAPPTGRRSWRDRAPQFAVRVRPELHELRAVVAVVDRSGRPGLWHLSVETSRRIVAAVLRRHLNVAAYEAESRFSARDDRVEYWTQRPDGTTARLSLTVGSAITATDIDRFLTARWRIVLPPRRWDPPGHGRSITMVHEPWILHRASVELFDDEVLVAAGLPPPAGPAQALWSPGTTVKLGTAQLDV